MKKVSWMVVGALAFAPLLHAKEVTSPWTGSVTLASDYIFRGISQTQHRPAVQAGIEYAHLSGFYVGTWASNVSWVRETNLKADNSLEWDFYGGYRGALADDVTFDVGVLTYIYPGKILPGAEDTNSTELYGALGWKFLTVKYSHTVSSYLFGWEGSDFDGQKTRGSGYWDVSVNYPLADGWSLQAHVGHQTIKNRSSASYTDWKVGVSKEVGVGVLALAYTGTNAKGSCAQAEDYCWNGKDVGKGRLVATFTKSF